MRRPSLLLLSLLLLCSTKDFARAEDGQVEADDDNQEQYDDQYNDDVNNQGDDNAQENQGDDNVQENQGDDNVQNNQGDDNAQVDDQYQNAQGDDAAQENAAYEGDDRYQWVTGDDTYSNSTGDATYLSQIQVCSDAVIQVQDIVTYCDSPGTFYYGSGKYRNNKYCQPGDKARVEISFYIAYADLIQQSGNYALVDVFAEADSSNNDGYSYSETVSIYDNADLCSLSTLKRTSRSQCPYNGYYKIKTHFYWQGSSNGVMFTPTITVGFKSNLKKNIYDYGGANTDLCRGSSFLTWSNGVRVSYANALGNFMKSFGILLVTTMLMGTLAWFLSKRPKSLREAKAQLREAKTKFMQSKLMSQQPFSKLNLGKQTHRDVSLTVDEEFDFRKIQTAGNRDLVDF